MKITLAALLAVSLLAAPLATENNKGRCLASSYHCI